ncbi:MULTISPECIES: hypothetical protein [Rhodopseudomonas]|uniref:hypothetical protein n=1 Tax=Rhodopseudomonas TaxID=1073 RepID=UPI000696C017|nr:MULTISPECIES: hypothetical protein [Rhodopseudomonas]MDF3811005.1 hypothetical protein [Rhodopseudomonas sp. BAL398]WOK15903.1 hypothetical protein RBJ75_17205 [Rhodopseudomonas sp. BAL398]
MVLALTYIFVGFAHTVSCADEIPALAMSSDVGTSSVDASHDGDSKKSPSFSEECHVWMPSLTAPQFAVTAPVFDPRKVAWAVPAKLVAGHHRLDPRPPKLLI